MKNKILLFASLMLSLASCSKNDDPVVVPPTTPTIDTTGDNVVTTYMVLAPAKIWTYDTGLVIGTSPTPGTAILNVGGDFIANGLTYRTMTAFSPPNAPASGFY